MPWEVTIINGTPDDRRPLGERESVLSRVGQALPGVKFELCLVPPQELTPEMRAMLPEADRDRVLRPQLEAFFEGDHFSIEFYCEDASEIDDLGANIRGTGDPLPALAAICLPNGWSAQNDVDRSLIDLASLDGSAWSRFSNWREKSINWLRGQIGDGDNT